MTIAHPAGFRTLGAIGFTGLFLPGKDRRHMTYTVVGGQSLPIGSVLGVITATNKVQLCKAAAGDGSQIPSIILQESVATFDKDGITPLDMSMNLCVGAHVNFQALQFDPSMIASVALQNSAIQTLRQFGIFCDTPNYSG